MVDLGRFPGIIIFSSPLQKKKRQFMRENGDSIAGSGPYPGGVRSSTPGGAEEIKSRNQNYDSDSFRTLVTRALNGSMGKVNGSMAYFT